MTRIRDMAVFFVPISLVILLSLSRSVMAVPQTKKRGILEGKVVTQKIDNPFLKALEEAKKRDKKGLHANTTAPNPFIELLKKKARPLNRPSEGHFPKDISPKGKEAE